MRLHVFNKLLAALDKPMNHEKLVTHRYPRADSVFCTDFHSNCRVGEWVILDQSGLIDLELGYGPTEDAAWQDAAENLAYQSDEEAIA